MESTQTLPGEAHARRTDPDTSHAAAASVKKLNERQAAVYRILRIGGPMHDKNLVYFYDEYRRIEDNSLPHQSESGIRTRRKELEDAGYVRKAGKARLQDTGNLANRYEIDPAKRPPEEA